VTSSTTILTGGYVLRKSSKCSVGAGLRLIRMAFVLIPFVSHRRSGAVSSSWATCAAHGSGPVDGAGGGAGEAAAAAGSPHSGQRPGVARRS
jgi:hypothetical protein